MLSFSGATLEEAAAQFARYSELRIIIDDPLVAQKRVVGLYSATDPEGFAHAVALTLGLRAERAPGGIRLRRDRQSVVSGKRVSVRVGLGGRRMHTKKTTQKLYTIHIKSDP